jgi:hypothetical protein
MKKIFLALVLMVAFVANAQKAYTPPAFAGEAGQWIVEYAGVAAYTLGTVTATTWSYAATINKPDGVFYVGKIKVSDKTTGAAGVCTVKLQGKYFAADAYTDITSVSWTGINNTDTTITYTSVTNKVYYRYLRFLVTNTGGKSKVDFAKLLIKK